MRLKLLDIDFLKGAVVPSHAAYAGANRGPFPILTGRMGEMFEIIFVFSAFCDE